MELQTLDGKTIAKKTNGYSIRSRSRPRKVAVSRRALYLAQRCLIAPL
jgi:hypothetical protein